METIEIYSDEQTAISSEGIEAEEYTTFDSRVMFAAYYNSIVRRNNAQRKSYRSFQKFINGYAI